MVYLGYTRREDEMRTLEQRFKKVRDMQEHINTIRKARNNEIYAICELHGLSINDFLTLYLKTHRNARTPKKERSSGSNVKIYDLQQNSIRRNQRTSC